jgi:4-hydroxybenzoate polyprenyltransferase
MIKQFLKYHPVHKKIVPNLDIVFLLRPTLFFSVWVMVVMGMYSAQMNLIKYPLWITEFSWRTFFVFLGLTLTSASTFILNQIEDLESDKINNKLFLVGEYFTPERSLSISRFLLVIGILLSVASNWFTSLFVISIYLIWGILYNKEPYSWKKKPLLGWIANSVIGVMLFMIGWYFVMTSQTDVTINLYDLSIFQFMLPYILCFSSVALLTTLPDVKGDIETGDETFPIVYGKMLTVILSFLLISSAFVFSLIYEDPLASTASIVSLPFFLFTAWRSLEKDILRSIRYPIFILNFFALTVYPWLFFPLVITYYLSKYYYWHRFELHYPTFMVDHD